MKDGFIKTVCAVPELKVADCKFNSEKIISMILKADEEKAALCVFPELSITGYTCGDLFFQKTLLDNALISLKNIAESTSETDLVSVIGLPVSSNGSIYSCAAVICSGKVLGIVPKKNIPNYREFYEARHFAPGIDSGKLNFFGELIPFGANMIFRCTEMKEFTFGIEICEDLWVADTPSVKLALNGANIIVNLSASNETIGKAEYRRTIVKAKSGSLCCVYLYANAGADESTTDMIYSGHSIIAENGSIFSESEKFENGMIFFDADLQKIAAERERMNTFSGRVDDMLDIPFSIEKRETKLCRNISHTPFVPMSDSEVNERCKEISLMQSMGLVKRLKHTHCKTAVIGLSGGLDSTLALIVTVNAFRRLELDMEGIKAVTMPCFGTTDRTYNNACKLARLYGAQLLEINIRESVTKHFEDISHDPDVHDVTYENSQARERTQILMDIANKYGGLVIGTGDLSELALGWATYNGDHMSMYAVNSSIPKTLVRYLVRYEAECCGGELRAALVDILDTPVSPELLPPEENGTISQKTEDIVGPYELHDFFLYYMVRFGFTPSKIFRLAVHAFNGSYDNETILKWEKTFYRRFFLQQFKRSCLPDGPKVGTVTLSPRSDLRMPSDACADMWMSELDNIKI